MYSLKTVFWDLDGTIADTELSGHRVAYNLAFKELSLKWNWSKSLYIDLLSTAGGKNRIKAYSNSVGPFLTDDYINRIYELKNNYYQLLVSNGHISPRTGVMRLVNELYKRNINQWIVTTSGRKPVENILNSFYRHKEHPFSGFICGEDVDKHKPNPEAYNLALNKSKSTIEQTIVIEDSIIGLQAATAANLKCIITLSPWQNHMKGDFKVASFVFNHLGDMDINCKCFHGLFDDQIVTYEHVVSALST